MCRSHVDEARARPAAGAAPACRPAAWRRAAISLVELLEVVGDARPSRAAGAPLRCAPRTSAQLRGRASRRSSWAASVSASRGSNSSPSSPSRSSSSYCGQPRRHRHRAAGHRAQDAAAARAPRRPRRPPRSSARAEVLRLASRRPAPANRTRSRRRRGSVGGRRRGRVARARSSRARRGRAGSRRSARRNRRSAPRSSSAENDDLGRSRPSPRAAAAEVGARVDHAVVAGEVALDQVARGGEARRAAVEPAEKQLDEAARDLGRENALGRSSGRCRRSARASGAARPRTRSGANGSCTCTKSSSARVEQLLDRARHVERQRHRPAAAGTGSDWPDREHRRAPGSSKSASGSDAAALDRSRATRARARASPTARRRARGGRAAQSSSESRSTKLVDLVAVLPGIGGDLRDREAAPCRAGTCPHGARLRSRASELIASAAAALRPSWASCSRQLRCFARAWR